MNKYRSKIKSLGIGAVLLALPLSFAIAEILPSIPKAKDGTQCVEKPDLMRTNHYDFMLHKREATMRDGIRTSDHSLKECVNCHVNKDDKGDYPQYGSNQHFCSSCHNYAAVTIDCFQCHTTKPEQKTGALGFDKETRFSHLNNSK